MNCQDLFSYRFIEYTETTIIEKTDEITKILFLQGIVKSYKGAPILLDKSHPEGNIILKNFSII